MKNKKNPVKRVIAVILSVLVVMTVCPLSVFADKAETFPIATLSDIHYYPEKLAGNKGEAYYTYLEGSSCIPDDLNAILDATFESLKYQIENEGLKYIVIPGDLTTNGEYEGHFEFAEKLRAFRAETGCEIYVINGNHDINNYDCASFINDVKEDAKITTPADFAAIYHDFGFDTAYHSYKTTFGDGTQGSLSYSIKTPEGFRFILADGGKYSSDVTKDGKDSHETAGAFSEAQLKWIIDEAKDAKNNGETPLLFTHWNLSGMNYFHEYLLQGFVIDDAYMLQEILADNGINYAFSGHQHVTDVDITYSDAGQPMYSVINPTLTQFPFSYRVTTFTKTEKGFSVDFNLCSVDEHSQVKTPGGSYYEAPFRTTGYRKQYLGRNGASEFLWKIVKKVLDEYVGKIRAEGSIIDFIESEFDMDLEKKFNELIKGGISIDSKITFTGANIMNLLRDIDQQLMNDYIYEKDKTYDLVENALIDICNFKFSDVPCTKFIDTYGFGSTSRGGNLGDLLDSILVYLYFGNEDISDDAFMKDILEQTESTELVDKIFSMAIEKILKPLIIDEILANTDLHIDKLFPEGTGTMPYYTGIAFQFLVAIVDNVMYARSDDADLSKIVNKLGTDLFDISFKRLIETVLETGLIKYGKTIDELLYALLDNFFDENNKIATAYQLNVLLDGMITDEDKDNNVTYKYEGPVKVTPTVEDMQLPSYLTVSYGKDASSSFNVTWFTKYSVTGSDLVFSTANNAKVKTDSVETEFSGFGFDFGSFGILPWNEKVIKHTATVTGLEAGTTYKFKVGDKTKNFMSDECSVTTAAKDKAFSFLAVSDTAAITPAQSKRLNDTLKAAKNAVPDASFIVHAGDVVREPENSDRWAYVLNGNIEHLGSLPVMAASGVNDAGEFSKYFTYNTVSQDETSGLFYSFDYDNAHFIVVNPNNALAGGGLSGEQLKWLRGDLTSNEKFWTVLVVNDTLYCSEDTNTSLRLQLLSYMKEYNIDLVIQGGNTYYARTALMNGDHADGNPSMKNIQINGENYNAYDEYDGYVVLCPGNAGYYPETEEYSDDDTEYSSAANGCTFSAVTIEGHALCVNSYSVDETGNSRLIDKFAISKTAETIMLGDADKDGKISVTDARIALRLSIGLEKSLSDAQIYACHVSDNPGISITDARTILRAAIKLEEIRPAAVTVSLTDMKTFADKVMKRNKD